MSDKNNLEDFFNSSLEGFNQEPSDSVWEKLNTQLDTTPPFWKTPLFWGFTTLALLIIGNLGGYFFLSEINQLSAQNEELISERRNLENELKLCSGTVKNLEQSVTTLKEINEKLLVDKTEIQKKTPSNLNSKTVIKGKKAIRNLSKKSQPEPEKTTGKFHSLPIVYPFDILKTGAELTLETTVDEQENYLKSLRVNTNHIGRNFFNPGQPPSFKKNIQFGPTTGIFTTFTDLNSIQKIGWNAGVSLQVQLFKNLGVTGEIRYNHNQYGIALDTDNQSLSTSFPHTSLINQSVKIFNVKNNYFDLPVGLKFNRNLPNRKGSFYINPGVSWQLFLPQRFGYETERDYISLNDERYFVYFGSAILNLGIEKSINKNLAYQIGIWGEKGLVKYGIERRQMTHLGLRSTLLFR